MSFFSISLYRVYVYMSMSFYIVLSDNCFGSKVWTDHSEAGRCFCHGLLAEKRGKMTSRINQVGNPQPQATWSGSRRHPGSGRSWWFLWRVPWTRQI